jgi:hypothetical protein
MSESEGPSRLGDPKARRLLALHAEHRKGLHVIPVMECIQCTFDSLSRHEQDLLEKAVEGDAS